MTADGLRVPPTRFLGFQVHSPTLGHPDVTYSLDHAMDLLGRRGATGAAPPRSVRDPDSPRARPLFEAASKIRDATPHLFPISVEVSVIVASQHPLPELEGYDPEDPMVEVLCDAGILADERLASRVAYLIDTALSGYAITVEPR